MSVYMGGVPAYIKDLEDSMEGGREAWVFDGYLNEAEEKGEEKQDGEKKQGGREVAWRIRSGNL